METVGNKSTPYKRLLVGITCAALMMSAGSLFATQTIGTMATSITGTFEALAKLITGGCYLAGLAFAVTAIMKFKQHKDNPTQITIGTPVSLVFIAAALLFMPSILSVAGYTMFGSAGGDVAGPGGSIYKKSGG